MATIKELTIKGYRSIKDNLTFKFPEYMPVVIIGENNAGKSNIVKALDLILGESWAGSHEPEDHEFWDRKPDSGPIEIEVKLSGCKKGTQIIQSIQWKYNPSEDNKKTTYKAISDTGNEQYMSYEIKDQCLCVFLGADRRLSYQLSYTNKWTLLSKIMTKFHNHLTKDTERVKRLKTKFEET